MVISKSKKSVICSRKDWVESQTSDRISQDFRTILERDGWEDYVFAFRDSDEIGTKMLARIAKKTGLKPENL